ncbi:MAG: ribosome biogenesis GTPase YlqF [Gammaproteobacteria bacterium]|nr:ribosome biogenesis GTPase YlqF [Gammaproteobacteria bacterium]
MKESALMELRPIQWYPGHMHKASKEARAVYKKVDVFIEMLDARVPFSSANPMLAALCGEKPRLKVFGKSDLADPELNAIWQRQYESENSAVVFADARKPGHIAAIPTMCRRLYAARGGNRNAVTAMVVGIPNAGKSTLINSLAGRTVARTGNEPAVTRQQQTIEINRGFRLLDTPGLMWPKVENPCSGYRLAVTGAIRDTALSHTDVAIFAIAYLRQAYRKRLHERYHLESPDSDETGVLGQIGRKRGCLVKGGEVDRDRAAKILIADIRAGRLGRITWETPGMRERETGEPDPVHEESPVPENGKSS